MYSKILVPLDGSKTAEKALPYARYLAGGSRFPSNCWRLSILPRWLRTWRAKRRRFLDTIIEDGVRQLHELSRGVATTFAGLDVRCSVKKGKAEDTIIEKAATDKAMLDHDGDSRPVGFESLLVG